MSPVSNLYDKLRDNAKLDADYRARNEQATWAFNKQSAEAVFSEQAARLYVANLKQKYAFQDVTFRARRAAVSRQLAYIQAQEHSKKDSILNYGNRLFHIRKLFNLSAKPLVIRVLALSKGAKELYG